MKKDITLRSDIELLVDNFYSDAIEDEHIGVFFTSVVQLNFELHIPIICNFWDSVLLGKEGYKGNPMAKHIEFSRIKKLEKSHFERWNSLWRKNVNDLFIGPTAAQAISRANQISSLMILKIENNV